MLIGILAAIALLMTSPIEGATEWPILLGLRLVVAAIGLFSVLPQLDEGEVHHLDKVLRPLLLVAMVPAAWIALQMLPTPYFGNPVWDSAATALGVTGGLHHISVDIGASALGFCWLILLIVSVVLAAAVTLDRDHAEYGLIGLTVLALAMAGGELWLEAVGDPSAMDGINGATVDCAALGATCSLACSYLAYERYETRYVKHEHGFIALCLIEALCFVAFCGCGLRVILAEDAGLRWAASVGIVTLVSVVLCRRTAFGAWLGGAIAAIFFIAGAGAVLALTSGQDSLPGAPPAAVSGDAAVRMLHDSPWGGIGAGAAPAMSATYKSLEDPASFVSPSAAVTLKTELGEPGFWILVALIILLSVVLLRSALRRGRDSIYPTLGTAALLTTLALGFVNTGIFATTTALISCGIVGLAFAQSESRKPL